MVLKKDNRIPRKTGQLLLLIVNLVDCAIWGILKEWCSTVRSVTLNIGKNDRVKNGNALTSISSKGQSAKATATAYLYP